VPVVKHRHWLFCFSEKRLANSCQQQAVSETFPASRSLPNVFRCLLLATGDWLNTARRSARGVLQ